MMVTDCGQRLNSPCFSEERKKERNAQRKKEDSCVLFRLQCKSPERFLFLFLKAWGYYDQGNAEINEFTAGQRYYSSLACSHLGPATPRSGFTVRSIARRTKRTQRVTTRCRSKIGPHRTKCPACNRPPAS